MVVKAATDGNINVLTWNCQGINDYGKVMHMLHTNCVVVACLQEACLTNGEIGVFESNSILRATVRASKEDHGLYGRTPFEASRVDSFLDAGTKVFNAAALTSYEDTWACCFEFNFQLIGFAGDQHVANAGRTVFLVNELANPIVFLKKRRICLAGGVPA